MIKTMKLTEDEICEIKEAISSGLITRKALAAQYKVNPVTITRIRIGCARKPRKKIVRDCILTQTELKKLLTYDELTGEFRWLAREDNRKTQYIGKLAGMIEQGYRKISIYNKGYKAHNLAFLYMTGSIPTLVDHKDRNSLNDAWSNLRVASIPENARNRKMPKNNTSGFTGVRYEHKQWSVRVWENRKPILIGYYRTFEAAVESRINAAAKYYGEFSPHI